MEAGPDDDVALGVAGRMAFEAHRHAFDKVAAVLEVSGVGIDDDFFLLGGDSLRGTRLLAHVKELFGVELPATWLFGSEATVAGMARAIESPRGRAHDAGERTLFPTT